MSSPSFRFKQFTVFHDRCGMKVGTDGVLLGAWAPVARCRRILDIGTGTGLIALMAAQRNPEALVTGIDIEPNAVCQAQDNVRNSPFAGRIRIHLQDVLKFSPAAPFDGILCNPPFYTEDVLPPSDERLKARHAGVLPIGGLCAKVGELLSDEGVFALIVPASLQSTVIAECLSNNLFLIRRLSVRTTPTKQPKRVLLAFSRACTTHTCEEELVLCDPDGNRSTSYQELTQDFYL